VSSLSRTWQTLNRRGCQHVIRRCRAVTKLGPGRLQSWARDVITVQRQAHHAVDEARVHGDTALDQQLLDGIRDRYDKAAAFGAIRNRLRDRDNGSRPGYSRHCRQSAKASSRHSVNGHNKALQ
jgi:hypothetical protein